MSERKGFCIRNQFAIHFLTFTIVGWIDIFSRKECRTIVIDSLKFCQTHKGLIVHAYIIMSNHIHLVARAEEGSIGLSGIIRDFKKFTARKIIEWLLKSQIESRKKWIRKLLKEFAKNNKNNEVYQVWKRDNHPVELFSPKFIKQRINYVHNNPVKAEIVDKADEYLYSSARNYCGRKDYILEVVVLDFENAVGYVRG